MSNFIPLAELKKDSRDPSSVVCYEGIWSDNNHRTWKDLTEGTAVLRKKIESVEGDKWLLYCEDSWMFLLAFVSLLQCKKEVMLPGNPAPAYVAEIKGKGPFFTDKDFSLENTFNIPALLKEKDSGSLEMPAIKGDESFITFFTSGTTGEPKMVRQRLQEFESDNGNLIEKWEWGNAFSVRKLCSTVDHHHIYGFVFSMLMPFTAGVPFRTKMIKTPEELLKFDDAEYSIITVPAFLKRSVEIDPPLNFNLKSPWILSSGGLLLPEIAAKAGEVFGFSPIEMYGSTETSGVGWRQSSQGIFWTPFPHIQIWTNNYDWLEKGPYDGLLAVRSPFIPNPETGGVMGTYETSDLVKILPDGKFILMGRLDSLVKIEEVRMSLPEMENRFTQSGLVSDVCVLPMEDKRQYLVAAIVFNAKGKEKFANQNKAAINKFWREYISEFYESVLVPKKWRYVDVLPANTQGKKLKEEIKKLFTEEQDDSSE